MRVNKNESVDNRGKINECKNIKKRGCKIKCVS